MQPCFFGWFVGQVCNGGTRLSTATSSDCLHVSVLLNRFFNWLRTVLSVTPASWAYSSGDLPVNKAEATRNSAGDRLYSLPSNCRANRFLPASITKTSANGVCQSWANGDAAGNAALQTLAGSPCRSKTLPHPRQDNRWPRRLRPLVCSYCRISGRQTPRLAGQAANPAV